MSERSLSIGWDCDDVLIPFIYPAVEHYNLTYNADVDVAHFYDGPEHWGVDDLSIAAGRVQVYMRDKIVNSPQDFINPNPDAVEVVHSLSRVHRQFIITGRSDFMQPMTNEMVDTHFADKFYKIIHTNHFDEHISRTKGSVCLEESADVLVDDGLLHCESAVEEGEVEVALLLDEPWNRDRTLHPKIIRCANLWVVREEIQKIARS